MIKLKYIFSAVFIITTLIQVKGQTIMTLEECRNQAIEANKEFKKASYQKKEAEANKKTARTAYLPSLSADATYMHLFNLGNFSMPGYFLPTADSEEAAMAGEFSGQSNIWSPGTQIELGDLSVIYGGLSLEMPIYTGGKIKYSNKQADIGVEMSELNYELTYSQLVEKTDNAFWTVATIEANIVLAEKYIDMLKELEDQMNEMYKLGLLPASEKLKVSVQKNDAELQLLKAKNGLKLAKMNLNHVLGQDLDTEIQINYNDSIDIEMVNLDNGLESALANRSEIKMMQKQVSLSEYDKKIAQSDYLPTAGVGLQYTGAWVKDLQEDVTFRPMLAAQISIPLFKWGQGKHKQKAASYKIQEAQVDMENTKELISLEVLQVKVQIEEAYETIKLAEKNIKEAEESLSETKASFDVGLNTTSDLLNAQAEWQKANANLISAKAQFKILTTSWEKVTGKLNIEEK